MRNLYIAYLKMRIKLLDIEGAALSWLHKKVKAIQEQANGKTRRNNTTI